VLSVSAHPLPDQEEWINEKSIERWARDEIAPEPLLPAQVEAAIQWCLHHLSRGVLIVDEAQDKALKTAARYDRMYAHAFLAYEGPQTEKRHAAEIDEDVIVARDDRDVAKLAYEHAQRTYRRLEKELSGFQSLNKGMNAAYGATTGFGAH
jgi:hypothetical protein